MKIRLLLAFLTVMMTEAFGQSSYLYVSHPQKFLSGYGTMESAVWVVRPKGNHAQCDLYMTFSARGLGFSAADSFEVQYYFALPDNAVVNDLWLWVGNDIMKALHMDVWTASTIYNGIVKRRRDPCLLTKSYSYHGYTQYNMRIYPLMGTGKRKIKFSYTVPVTWTVNGPLIDIPRDLLNVGQTTPLVRVRVIPDTAWQNPRLMELTSNPFTIFEDSVAGPVYQCDLSGSLVSNAPRLTLTFGKELTQGYLLEQHSHNGENYYQLGLVPGLIFPMHSSRHIAVLLDLDSSQALFGTSDFISGMRSFMLSRFFEKDTFNIFYSSVGGLRRASAGWFAGGAAGVNAAMDSIAAGGGPRYQQGVASVSGLLKMGLDLVHAAGGDGSVLLVTSSTDYLDYRIANNTLSELRPWLSYGIPVNVAEFGYYWNRYQYIDGQYWYGDQYFNKNLAQATNGVYFTDYDYYYPLKALARVLEKAEPYLQAIPEALDVNVVPSGGLTLQRCKPLSSSTQLLSWSRGILESGKFVGESPFTVNVSALYKGQVYLKTFTIGSSSAVLADSTLAQNWAGAYIKQLESSSSSTLNSDQILKLSLEQRVLATTTAFLALEPNDTLKACLTCKDESGPPLAVRMKNDRPAIDSLVQIYPNPFNSSTKISVRLPKGVRPEQARLGIFNVLGQLVRTFDSSLLTSSTAHTYTWDGSNDRGNTVSSGVYFFTLTTPKGTVTTRLLLSK